MEESLMKVLKACLLSFFLALLFGRAYSQQCPANKHWKVHNGKCLPSCGAAKGEYCRNNRNKCRSNAGFVPTLKHCSKTQPSYPDGRTTVRLESYQHNGNCCLVLPPPSRASVTTPRTPASSPAPSSSANQGSSNGNPSSLAPSSSANQGSSNANPSSPAPSSTATRRWSCSGAHCDRELARTSVKNLCSPENRWMFYIGNCYASCLQSAEMFCRDNDCTGYTLLMGGPHAGLGSFFVREEYVTLAHWLPMRYKGKERVARMGCTLTRGAHPGVYRHHLSNDPFRPRQKRKNMCPKTQRWNHAPKQEYTTPPCYPSCQVMVDNFCRGRDCSGLRTGSREECAGGGQVRFRTNQPKTQSRRSSCCLVAKDQGEGAQPARVVNLGPPRSPVPVIDKPQPPRSVHASIGGPHTVNGNRVCKRTSIREAKRSFTIELNGVRAGDKMTVYKNGYCLRPAPTSRYAWMMGPIQASSSQVTIKVPITTGGDTHYSVWIEPTHQCVAQIPVNIGTGYEPECAHLRPNP